MSCPCGSELNYIECCEPYINGKPATTAESLLRSRYSAFVKNEISYIKSTTHPEKLHEFNETEVREWSTESQWQKLNVNNVVGGTEEDEEGQIEFVANFKQNNQSHSHFEISTFKKLDGKWFFYDAQYNKGTVKRETPKVGRNEPCPCGSGKKYKKCCGAA